MGLIITHLDRFEEFLVNFIFHVLDYANGELQVTSQVLLSVLCNMPLGMCMCRYWMHQRWLIGDGEGLST
jgi:hypothetical protein